jgi:hypothetical protein
MTNAFTLITNMPYMNIKGVTETITPKTVTDNAFTVDFLNDSNVISITPSSGTGTMTATIINVPVATSRSYTITAIINTSTHKVRIGTVLVNTTTTGRTLFFVNGATGIPSITTASRIIQTMTIVYGSDGLVDAVYSSVNPYLP